MKPAPFHTLTVAAKVIEAGRGNHELVEHLHGVARALNRRRFEQASAAEQKRIERQRTLFAMLPDTRAVDQLKAAMLQRAYDSLWDGDGNGCDAILEFLPERDVGAMLDAWESDQEGEKPKSDFYG